MLDAAAALARIPMFRFLGRVELARLAGELDEVSLAPDEVLFRQGDPGDAFYVVRDGQAQVYTGDRPDASAPILVGPGQALGEMALLTGEPRSASVRAYGRLALWRMPADRFHAVLAHERNIALSIERALSRRLAATLSEADRARADARALARVALEAADPEARRLFARLSAVRVWPAAAVADLRADPAASAALDRLLALGGPVRADGDGIEVLPALVGAFRGDAGDDDRVWLARAGRRLAEAGEPACAVPLLLAAGEGGEAARVALSAPEALAAVPAAVREEWPAAAVRAGADPGTAEELRAVLAPSAAPVAGPSPADGDRSAARPAGRSAAARAAGIAAAAAMVAVGWLGPVPDGLDRAAAATLWTVGAAIPLLLAEALPMHLVGLALAAGLVIPGLVDPQVALGGFASPSWVMIAALFAVSGAVARSGLTYRLALKIAERLPGNLAVQSASLLGLAAVLTGGIASSNARVALAAPAVRDLAEAMRLARGTPGAAVLGLTTLHGFGMMNALFVTGTTACLLLHAMLPEPFRAETTWTFWFVASLAPHVVLAAGFLVLVLLAHRPRLALDVDRRRVAVQLALLGPLTRQERFAMAALALLGLGFALRPLHGIPDVWVAVGVCFVLYAARVMEDGAFRTDVDWGLMLFYGVVMGVGPVFSAHGLDAWLVEETAPLMRALLASPGVFAVGLAALCAALRFVTPWTTLCVTMALATIPVAVSAGIHPLVPVLTILISADHAALPFVNETYYTMRHASGGRLYDAAQARLPLLLDPALRVLAVAAAVPVWDALGLLGGGAGAPGLAAAAAWWSIRAG
jgi:CRP-like cAMP-binding protein/di/tricarboxylate transporter